MRIADVALFRVEGRYAGPRFPQGNRQINQLALYPPQPAQSPPSLNEPAGSIEAIYVEVVADDGVSGNFGPIDEQQAFVIRTLLRPFLIGRDALAIELLHDQMLRLNRHGRSGFFMTAMSVIDCALWDLRGKAWGQPVYRLLGGPTRDNVPAYASMLGFSVEPHAAAATALQYQEAGFAAQKWFFAYGPRDGAAGQEANLALALALREALGPHYPLMFDAFMGWDVSYAREMAGLLAPMRPRWLEEPIPPERVGGLRRVRSAGVPVATGEHVYTRWQIKELLVAEAVDVLQADPDWTGGISELFKIGSLASAFEVPLYPHGHSLLPALHLAAASSPATVPMVEYLVQFQESKQYFHHPIYRPERGAIALPELPGLGLVLDESRIERRETLS